MIVMGIAIPGIQLRGASFEVTFLISVFVHVLVLMWISTSENTVNNLESPIKARVNIRYESPLNQHSDKTKPQKKIKSELIEVTTQSIINTKIGNEAKSQLMYKNTKVKKPEAPKLTNLGILTPQEINLDHQLKDPGQKGILVLNSDHLKGPILSTHMDPNQNKIPKFEHPPKKQNVPSLSFVEEPTLNNLSDSPPTFMYKDSKLNLPRHQTVLESGIKPKKTELPVFNLNQLSLLEQKTEISPPLVKLQPHSPKTTEFSSRELAPPLPMPAQEVMQPSMSFSQESQPSMQNEDSSLLNTKPPKTIEEQIERLNDFSEDETSKNSQEIHYEEKIPEDPAMKELSSQLKIIKLKKRKMAAQKEYNRHIQNMVQPKLKGFDTELFVRIKLFIGTSGEVIRFEILEKSVSDAFNQAVLLSIRNANLQPLPSALAEKPPYIVPIRFIPFIRSNNY